MDASEVKGNKPHRAPQAGAKADKKKAKKQKGDGTINKKNAKAFGVAKYGRVHRTIQRNLDLAHRKDHVAITERAPGTAPPVVVVVMGPKGSGKSTLIRSLVKRYTKHTLTDIRGPVTVVTGKNRRVTFYECPNDLNAMIDLAKIADIALLMVDGSFGFEMETFEFLNILQVHGFPRVMGVLTHLDGFKDSKKLRRVKKTLKQRFWVEIHDGAKLFYLSGLSKGGQYPKTEINNLALYLSRQKFRPLTWRSSHSYALVDRVEDLTDSAAVQEDPTVDRTVALFGYVRGMHLKPGASVHIPGAGDFRLADLTALPDPIPLPEQDPEKRKQRRTLSAKETLLYAPMSNVGAVFYDADAVYINVHKPLTTRPDLLLGGAGGEGTEGGSAGKKGGPGEGGMTVLPTSSLGFGHGEEDEDEDDGRGSEGGSSEEMDAETAMMRARGGSSKQSAALRSADGLTLMRNLQRPGKSMDDAMGGVSMSIFRGGAGVKDRDAADMLLQQEQQEDEEEYDNDGDEYDDEEEEDEEGVESSEEEDSDEEDDSDEEGEEEQDEEEEEMGQGRGARPLPKERRVTDSSTGRVRRAAVFDIPEDEEEREEEEEESEEEEEERDEGRATRQEAGGGARWKTGLASRAEAALAARKAGSTANVMELVYGSRQASRSSLGDDELGHGEEGGEDSDASDFFVPVRKGTLPAAAAAAGGRPGSAGRGSAGTGDPLAALLEDENAEGVTMLGAVLSSSSSSSSTTAAVSAAAYVRNRFVTGDAAKAALSALAGASGVDDDEDEDEGGDFEDLQGAGDEDEAAAAARIAARRRQRGAGSDSEDYDEEGDDDDEEEDGGAGPLSDAQAIAAERARNAQRKAQAKAAFDAEYDRKKNKDTDEEGEDGQEGAGAAGAGAVAGAGEEGKSTIRRVQDALNEELTAEEVKADRKRAQVQSEINKNEFVGLPDALRARMTGFPAGTYVRMRLEGVPCEFIQRFKPSMPVIVGGLLAQEEGLSMLRTRVKKHRWHKKILKSSDPLVFSIGWRRFQSLPVYSTQDDNERHRYLKYTPENMHCYATFYGPITPPNSGLMAFKTLAGDTSAWRVACSGTVLEVDEAFKVVKKLKLTGVPHKIFKKTAFVRGMFTSELEIAKFEGAAIKTVSGIRGSIKKAVGTAHGPPGTFRATFEDRILMSDIVFCRTWVPVEAKKLYNPITSLLDAPVQGSGLVGRAGTARRQVAAPGGTGVNKEDREVDGMQEEEEALEVGEDMGEEQAGSAAAASAAGHPGGASTGGLLLMRPHAALRREAGISVEPNADSLYTKIERPEVRKFNPLHIPKSLQAALPFSSKPKQTAPKGRGKEKKGGDYWDKRAVVMEKDERKAHGLMQKVFTVAKEKVRVAKAKRREEKGEYEAKKAKDDQAKFARQRQERKRKYAMDQADKTRAAKKPRRGGGGGGGGGGGRGE